jgi:hypothetical protein
MRTDINMEDGLMRPEFSLLRSAPAAFELPRDTGASIKESSCGGTAMYGLGAEEEFNV